MNPMSALIFGHGMYPPIPSPTHTRGYYSATDEVQTKREKNDH